MNFIAGIVNYFTGQSTANNAPPISVGPQILSMIVSVLDKAIPAVATWPQAIVSMIVSFVTGWILLGLIIWAALQLLGTWLRVGIGVAIGVVAVFALLFLHVI